MLNGIHGENSLGLGGGVGWGGLGCSQGYGYLVNVLTNIVIVSIFVKNNHAYCHDAPFILLQTFALLKCSDSMRNKNDGNCFVIGIVRVWKMFPIE